MSCRTTGVVTFTTTHSSGTPERIRWTWNGSPIPGWDGLRTISMDCPSGPLVFGGYVVTEYTAEILDLSGGSVDQRYIRHLSRPVA